VTKKYLASALLFAAIVAGTWLYVGSQKDLFGALRRIAPGAVLFLIGLRFLFLASHGFLLRELALKRGISLRTREWFGLAFTTAMGNFMIPLSGGMIARAAYLKHRHGLAYPAFVSLLAATYLPYFWVLAAGGLTGLILFVEQSTFYWEMLSFFALILVIDTILILLPALRLPGRSPFAASVNSALEGWVAIRNDRMLLLKLGGFGLINILLNGLCFWWAYTLVASSPPAPGPAFLVSLFAMFSVLSNITPGGLGVQEGLVTVSSGLLGMGPGEGLIVSVMIRIATLIPAFILGALFAVLLGRQLTGNRGPGEHGKES
jgi:uncharacterized membrane protein YbhN (UPF0104 family)